MSGPCLCGDIFCASCGPAQGNGRCEVCGAWTFEGGCADPEDCGRKSAEIEAAMAREFEDSRQWEQQAIQQGLVPDYRGHWH